MIALLAKFLLPLLAVAAGVFDFIAMRIPNWLNAAIALSMVAVALLMGMPLHLFGLHLLTGAVVLVLGFGLFAGGFIGGGDAKLLAAVALWMGWPQVVMVLGVTSLAGGALAIAMKAWQAIRIEHTVRDTAWLKQVFRAKLDLPYGAAIAVGAVVAYPDTWWMQAFV